MASTPKKALSGTPRLYDLYDRIRSILESASAGVARTVNTTQVAANWLVGREIVEEEQAGTRRAGYGAKVLANLSARLESDYGKGYSVDNLESFRQFYLDYPRLISETASRNSMLPAISETASRKLPPADTKAKWQLGSLHPGLSWSHYRSLLRERRPAARAFYEIEAINNAWSVRELSRQISSLLFERTVLHPVKLSPAVAQVHPDAISIFKDSYMVEFLGLPHAHAKSNLRLRIK